MRPQDGLRLLLLGAIWGASYPLIKLALRGIPILTIVGGRLFIGTLLLAGVLVAKKTRFPRREVWPALLLMALVANVLPFFLITWGEQRITSALTAVLNSTTPLFTVLIAMLMLKQERSGALRLIGIAVGFIGVGVIVGGGGGSSSVVAELAVVLAAVSYAFSFIIARKSLTGRGYSSLAISTGQLAAASVLMVPVVTFESIVRPPHLTAVDSSSLLLLGAMGTGVAYLLYYRLVADTGATSASLVTYLIPVFGAALGWLVLDETLGVRALVGAVLVIAGIAIAEGLGSKGEDERQFAEPPAGVSNAGSAAPGPGPSG